MKNIPEETNNSEPQVEGNGIFKTLAGYKGLITSILMPFILSFGLATCNSSDSQANRTLHSVRFHSLLKRLFGPDYKTDLFEVPNAHGGIILLPQIHRHLLDGEFGPNGMVDQLSADDLNLTQQMRMAQVNVSETQANIAELVSWLVAKYGIKYVVTEGLVEGVVQNVNTVLSKPDLEKELSQFIQNLNDITIRLTDQGDVINRGDKETQRQELQKDINALILEIQEMAQRFSEIEGSSFEEYISGDLNFSFVGMENETLHDEATGLSTAFLFTDTVFNTLRTSYEDIPEMLNLYHQGKKQELWDLFYKRCLKCQLQTLDLGNKSLDVMSDNLSVLDPYIMTSLMADLSGLWQTGSENQDQLKAGRILDQARIQICKVRAQFRKIGADIRRAHFDKSYSTVSVMLNAVFINLTEWMNQISKLPSSISIHKQMDILEINEILELVRGSVIFSKKLNSNPDTNRKIIIDRNTCGVKAAERSISSGPCPVTIQVLGASHTEDYVKQANESGLSVLVIDPRPSE